MQAATTCSATTQSRTSGPRSTPPTPCWCGPPPYSLSSCCPVPLWRPSRSTRPPHGRPAVPSSLVPPAFAANVFPCLSILVLRPFSQFARLPPLLSSPACPCPTLILHPFLAFARRAAFRPRRWPSDGPPDGSTPMGASTIPVCIHRAHPLPPEWAGAYTKTHLTFLWLCCAIVHAKAQPQLPPLRSRYSLYVCLSRPDVLNPNLPSLPHSLPPIPHIPTQAIPAVACFGRTGLARPSPRVRWPGRASSAPRAAPGPQPGQATPPRQPRAASTSLAGSKPRWCWGVSRPSVAPPRDRTCHARLPSKRLTSTAKRLKGHRHADQR